MPEVNPIVDTNLGPPPPQQGQGGLLGGMNPLQAVGSIVGIQNAMNQNRMFQQQFQAKQAIGEIIATAPDLETGLQRAAQSPYGAWAPDIINSYRQATLTQQQLANAQQEGSL